MPIKIFFIGLLLLPNFTVMASEFDELDDLDLDFDIEMGETTAAPWRMIFAWQNGIDSRAIDNTKTHRFDARIDWGQLLFDDYFFKIDAKAIIRLPGDDNKDDGKKIELDGRLRALYLQSSQEAWTVTTGFQTITLGEMDVVQVIDFLSPWDYSEFAFTAPEDARLGQLLFNAEWYSGQARWQMLYSPWPLRNRYPGGDGNNLIQQLLGNESIMVRNNQPEPFADHEMLLQWKKSFEGSDVTFIYANLLSNDPVFNLISSEHEPSIRFAAEYYRFNLFSVSANYSAGNSLWKLESAYKRGMKYQSPTVLESNAWDIAMGLDYDANGAWNTSIEILNQHIFANETERQTLNKNSTQIVLRWSKSWLNETLDSVVFASYQFQYGDTITSLSFDYAIDDHWKSALVATVFNSTDPQSPGQLTKDWDQITVRISYAY